ncbi:uncharacterized protein CIMG_09991 [Coccidioides immitis RS]|uniref:Uncharacterized protein n=1 Tax=Coccidioides immitis (strain RS) TaxID=246410 RepID=J3K0K6_COCIM|nr:uncharacterized protein CIMG_09991 [Coccidioides immitis RS]EAS27386.3 hypothetical protein CIMG_09991 [Coccidioides immitis RS]
MKTVTTQTWILSFGSDHLLPKLQNLEGSAEGKCDPCEASPGIPKKDRDIPMNEKPAKAHQKRQEVSALIICYIHG